MAAASSSAASGLRLRVLEPAVGAVGGGSRVVVHGKGFRPPPHSLLVRFRLAETGARVDVAAKFLLETQLECVVPSFKDDARAVLARRTTLPPTSATLAQAPHLVPVQVEVIVDSDRVSNALVFLLHQDVAITKITPQFVLMTPPTTVTVTTNLLKLSGVSRLYPQRDKANAGATAAAATPQELTEISELPVFVRVRQVSERTSAVSERTVEARWRVSPVGVYEVEFDAVMMTFGDATVELTLNRHDFFRAKIKTPDAVGYCVHRDVTVTSIDPCCVSVTSGRSTEVRLLGEGLVDSGELTVRLLQRDIQEAATNGNASASAPENSQLQPVAQLSATFVNPTEIRCNVPPNMSFGLTHFQVSLNGGRQYGRDRSIALLHRDRAVAGIEPSFASLDGNTTVQIRLARLTVDIVDAPHQIQNLIPPRRVRVKFEAVSDDDEHSCATAPIVKVVSGDIPTPSRQPATGGRFSELDEYSVVSCRVPSFLEEMKLLKEKHAAAKTAGETSSEFRLVRQFRISLSLGGDSYFGYVPFGCFFPPVIQSMTRHHGPCSGGTIIFLRMKYRVPSELDIQVRFLQLATRKVEIVRGIVGTKYFTQQGLRGPSEQTNLGSPSRSSQERQDNPSNLIVCTAPPWSASKDSPVLTKVQVSLDGGFNFVPTEEEHELVAAGLATSRSKGIPPQLVKDMSYLYFLFYPVPRLFSVSPMSADIQGGSFIRIGGDHIVDHGGRISVVFQSPVLSRKVVGFVENGELRCCVPPFNVGPVTIFVSLNGDQYTKCEFIDPDSKRSIDFVFYSSPLLQRLSPLCTSISHSSLIRIFGVNLIETGRVKVRFGFTNQSGKLVFKDVPGRAQDGVIMAQSPLFAADYGNLKAVVDVALNGNDFSGKMLSLYYYASYSIKRVEPSVGAIDIPIPVTLYLSQSIISDDLLVRVRFKQPNVREERTFGPIPVVRWESNRVDFLLPPLCEFARALHDFENAFVDVSFDKVYFHQTGDLLRHYRPYKLPPVITISPLVGQFEQETTVVARCSDLQEDDLVTMTLTLDFPKVGKSATVAVVADTNSKRHTLTWKCPSLSKLVKVDVRKVVNDEEHMVLPARLSIQMSTINGQLLALPFHFQYYRMPVLLSMSPRVGYICGGSLISFEFKEPIETPTIDFRFGTDTITSGRVRDDNKRFVECLSPALPAGVHVLAMSFDEQYFEDVYLAPTEVDSESEGEDEGLSGSLISVDVSIPEEAPASSHAKFNAGNARTKCVFQAFAMPQFTIPANLHRVYGFGPLDGGSHVVIKGTGFIADGKIYVRFSSLHGDCLVGPSGAQSEIVVKARVLDDTTILCTSPPSTRAGRVLLQVTYNLQQYTNSSCFFEYHEQTKFASRGILCGPVSGGTPVCIQVEDPAGLPQDKTLLSSNCAIRFVSEITRYSLTVDALFDEETLQIQCIAPSWPSNELVAVEVALSKDAANTQSAREFFATSVRFLFYDPPEGLITIEPSAGPITGGTEVLAHCGKMVDTGEIMVSVTISDQQEEQLKMLTSVGEDEEDEEDSEGEDPEAKTNSSTTVLSNKEVYLVKGKIVGEAVSFIAPAVSKPGVAFLNIALNGINYTSTQTSTLRYKYYCEPVIRRISPTWSAIDTSCVITLNGDFIEDHGCRPVVLFQQQQLSQQGKEAPSERILVDGTFVDSASDPKSAAAPSRALQCSFLAPQAGYYEIQISLNGGQQFSNCRFMSATFGNYSGTARTALLPFRSFSSPFLLATPTGSVAGGSTVTLFMNKKLCKLLARETKCNVQFVPIRNGDAVATGGTNLAVAVSPQKSGATEGVIVVGEIDLQEAKITCRAPLLRTACVATMDLLLPTLLTSASEVPATVGGKTPAVSAASALTSCCTFFGAKEREKFHAYESPTITELAPSCGPLSGGTCMVIECSNIVDTGQIFVRFRSTANERECILVPATFSRTFPDGSLSASPLLLCRTPTVDIIDRIVVSVSETTSSTAPTSPIRGSGPRDASASAITAKARAHTFQQMAEASLRNRDQNNVLRVTRAVLKSAQASSIGAAISVLVDFTMNAGEQFIAHSVPFQFYPVIDPREIKWFPRHLPTQCFDRSAPTETRIVTIQLPKTLRTFTDSASAAERVSFYFEGAPQQLFSPTQKRRGSSIVLHETGDARELVVLDALTPAKLRKESTMRRRSTFFRNSSISATSNNLLDSSSAALSASGPRPRAPIPRGAGPRRPSGVPVPSGNNVFTGSAAASGVALTSATSPPSSQTSSPYIAAKIVKGGLEITCPVPEFAGCGTVQVFFSFNAQQFVCLGELHVHEPLTIRENRQHLFTSNIGGDRFTLFCSLSSVFDFLATGDVLNEREVLVRQRRDAGIVKISQVLRGICADEPDVHGASGALLTRPASGSEGEWRDRLFHVLQVQLVPPNPRLLRKLVVSARSLGSRAELATSSPDDFGCCVFETTEWVADMLLLATPPAGSGVSSFSRVLPKNHHARSTAKEETTTACSSNRTHALLVHLPADPEEIIAYCSINPTTSKQLVIVNAVGLPVQQATTISANEQYTAVSFHVSPTDDIAVGYFVCLDTRNSESGFCEVQVVVANSVDAQVYLTGVLMDAGIWVVALVSRGPSGRIAVLEIDCRVNSLEDLATSEILAERRASAIAAANEIGDRAATVALPTHTAVSARVNFSCADSSRNLSASGDAQLILPDAHTLASFKDNVVAAPCTDLVLQCEMPALPFNGPTILFVQVDGVTFSNSLIVHCYDPRLWRITRIDPPCGLVHQPLKLRITGEHFVDNKKTIIRFSDATRYQNFSATMERYRLLVVRVATVRNLRSLLPPQFASAITTGGSTGSHSPQKVQQLQSQQNRDEISGHSPFIVVARVEYHTQVFQATSRESAVLAALASSSNAPPLGWEDQFEVQIPAHAMTSALLLVTLELVETSGSRSTWELGRTVIPTDGLQEAVLTKRTYLLEEHFRWRNRGSSASVASDVEVFLHLSPMMTQQDVFVCDVSSFAVPQRLRVQISSGDSFFSPCPAVDQPALEDPGPNAETQALAQGYRPLFQAYELPVVVDTAPRVLPRTAGGEIVITGEGFIDCGDIHCIWVRLFACPTVTHMSEQALIGAINATASLYSASGQQAFFVRDVKATFISSTTLKVMIPPRLATYNLYYRVSVDDGVHFSLATLRSHVLLYSADTVEPKGGPVSGNTYVAVHGSNLNACMALGGLSPVVKLTWMRGTKELEHIIVRGEFYPPEDIVYFYTPQSKFGLQNITVHVEVSLVVSTDLVASSAVVGGFPTAPTTVVSNIATAFGQDEIPFVIYRTPTIKAIAPLHSLVCGLSSLELIVQGLDEKATILLKGSIKARFKRRGQMQVADVQLNSGAGGSSEGKLVTIVPRFVVGSANATEVTSTLICSSPTRQQHHLTNRTQGGPVKVWTRQGAVFVVLLRARNLFVAKKTSTCNPFVVIHCNKAQLKSTRKDGTSSPVWNEIFDFDWRSEAELPRVIRLSVENQLSSNQSELLGQVAITFANAGDLSKPFCTRAWFPLRRVSSRGASNLDSNGKRVELGDVEVAIAFIPVPPKRAPPRFLQAAALKTSIMSAMQQQKKAATATTTQPQQDTPRSRKERLLRAFRRHGAPSSLVPSEIVVELAVNGQDFWSSAPSRCLAVSTPIVLTAEPSFICMSGGSPLTISGMNFVQSGMLRVAFAVVGTSGNEPSKVSALLGKPTTPLVSLDSKRIVMVEARYRSSHCITCVTPPLQALGATDSAVVNVYVTINGLDFDSVALPLSSSDPITEDPATASSEGAQRPLPAIALVQNAGEKYVINNKVLCDQATERGVVPSQTLLHQVRVYLRPVIRCVRPADGVYTSSLIIEGSDFSNTGIVIARYCSKNDPHDIRTCRVNVISPQRLECTMPDFPRGTVVTMSIAVNGIEFVPCPGEFAVFQSPRLTEIIPNWISIATNVKQDVRILGINLTTNSSASGSVQVSFQRGDVKKIIKGQCVDGEVLCSVPPELMMTRNEPVGVSDSNNAANDVLASIFVDVWLGGTHKTFTTQPLELHLYRNIPAVTVVAPTNGPIYGGYTVTIEGSGFINTGKIVARFQLLHEDGLQQTSLHSDPSMSPMSAGKAVARQLISSPAVFVDVSARFVSTDTLVCSAPSFPQEGVYSVAVALNGVEFNTEATIRQFSTWFLVWQNWQRRKQLAAQRLSLEMALTIKVDDPAIPFPVDLGVPLPTTPASSLLLKPSSSSPPSHGVVETAFGRRTNSRAAIRSPRQGSDNQEPISAVAPESPRRQREQLRLALDKMVEDESLERAEDHFVDLRLLQWHPATADDRSQSLAVLLSELFNAPETQQIMIRRIGFVFRVRGSRDASSGQYVIGSLASFTHALKLIFPHAPDKQFEEVWRMVDPAQLGFVSLHSLTKWFIVTESIRPPSPEPGPTHYNPSYSLVETKPPVPIILPQSSVPAEEAGLPSELFMNYDAFKAVRPRVKGGTFLKRELMASWCNPVPKDKLFQLETDEELERTFVELQQSKKGDRLGSLASSSSSPRALAPRPPSFSASAPTGNRSKWKPQLGQNADPARDSDDSPSAGGGVSRGERLARAAAANESNATKMTSPRGPSPASGGPGAGRFPASRARSILHDDIAPLYLKFLRSKDAQKGNSMSNE